MNKKISVIVLNWNGENILNEYLPYWKETCCEDYSQLIIVDNGSTDNSVNILKRETDIKKIFFDKNYGFALGYNKAVSLVDTEYVVLLNSDVETTKGWLEKPLMLLEKDKTIGAVQPKIISRRNPELFEYAGAAGGFIDKYGYPFCRGRVFDTIETDKGQYNDQCDIFWASGAALFIRTKEFIDIGGFDDSFFAHQEEIDLCWRLKNKGKRIVYCPDSKVLHYGGATLDMNNPKKTYLNFRNNLLMIYKNINRDYFYKTFIVRFFLDISSSLFFALKLDFGNSISVLKGIRDFFKMKKQFKDKRQKIQSDTNVKQLVGIKKYSIVYQYFIRNKKIYSELEN